ncbi:MAG: hypothetical protein ABR955_07120 [Verrucomicrobiota bacterium]|jgi:hypothetical protein
MNNQTRPPKIVQSARIVFALFATILLIPALYAQPEPQKIQNRFLLIFDTSSLMKKCLPTTRVAVKKLLFSMMDGQLQPGDTIGVWTFAKEVGPGRFPLQQWQPENAATIAANITAFVESQRYRKSTDFEATMLLLSAIVEDSDRLTVLIFCDGDGEMNHTPFDDAINKMFEKNRRPLQKALQPFVVVLRSQTGVYVGYTVNSAAGPPDFPQFPPIPQAPEVTPPNPPPPPAPVVIAPPLIIIGTNVGTNLPPHASPAPKLEMTNSQSSAAQTNLVAETNVVFTPAKTIIAQTNTAAPSPENAGISSGSALKIGVTLFIGAVALVTLMICRARKADRSSLITRSMDDKK